MQNNALLGIITLEYEFWNDNTFPTAQILLTNMYSAKSVVQAMHPGAMLETEIYLGNIGRVATTTTLIEDIADYIDGNATVAPNGPLLDRMLFTTYGSDPNTILVNGGTNYYDNVYNAFEHPVMTSPVRPANNRPTPFHPLFSSCSTDLGFGDEGFAKWFRRAEGNNIFSAEKIYYNQHFNFSHAANVTAATKNTNSPGAARWFVYSQMIHDNFSPVSGTNNTRKINTFYSNSPVMLASAGSTTANLIFTYSGPIEQEF